MDTGRNSFSLTIVKRQIGKKTIRHGFKEPPEPLKFYTCADSHNQSESKAPREFSDTRRLCSSHTLLELGAVPGLTGVAQCPNSPCQLFHVILVLKPIPLYLPLHRCFGRLRYSSHRSLNGMWSFLTCIAMGDQVAAKTYRCRET
jgi:hypothetical protein